MAHLVLHPASFELLRRQLVEYLQRLLAFVLAERLIGRAEDTQNRKHRADELAACNVVPGARARGTIARGRGGGRGRRRELRPVRLRVRRARECSVHMPALQLRRLSARSENNANKISPPDKRVRGREGSFSRARTFSSAMDENERRDPLRSDWLVASAELIGTALVGCAIAS